MRANGFNLKSAHQMIRVVKFQTLLLWHWMEQCLSHLSKPVGGKQRLFFFYVTTLYSISFTLEYTSNPASCIGFPISVAKFYTPVLPAASLHHELGVIGSWERDTVQQVVSLIYYECTIYHFSRAFILWALLEQNHNFVQIKRTCIMGNTKYQIDQKRQKIIGR